MKYSNNKTQNTVCAIFVSKYYLLIFVCLEYNIGLNVVIYSTVLSSLIK